VNCRLCVVSFVAVTACGFGRSQQFASVEGDVYLVMQNGDTKRGAGRTVYLVADPDSATFRRMAAACDSVKTQLATLRSTSTKETIRAFEQRLRASRQLADTNPYQAEETESLAEKSNVRAQAAIGRFESLYRQLPQRIAAMLPNPLDSARAGMEARYFLRMPSGSYLLYSEWLIGDIPYQWVVPIKASAGDSLRKDLDNGALGVHPCGSANTVQAEFTR